VSDLVAEASPALASLAVAALVGCGREAQARAPKAYFRLGLPGGRSPVPVFRSLRSSELADLLDWTRVLVFLADERAVPPDDPDSNRALIEEELAAPLGIPQSHLLGPRGDAADLEAEALSLEDFYAPLDLLLLGLGEDGHVASLFPGSPLLGETRRRLAVVWDSPKPPARRVTITPVVLREARRVLVLVSGPGKGDALARAFRPMADPFEVPATLLRDRDWLVNLRPGFTDR
jgi:6-phosphogluconolactonase